MKIKIEKKNNDKFLLLMGFEKDVKGFYLSKEDLLKIKSNVEEMLEYDSEEVGDSI